MPPPRVLKQAGLHAGTGIALLGTYLYTEVSKKYKAAPKPSPPTTPTGTVNAV